MVVKEKYAIIYFVRITTYAKIVIYFFNFFQFIEIKTLQDANIFKNLISEVIILNRTVYSINIIINVGAYFFNTVFIVHLHLNILLPLMKV